VRPARALAAALAVVALAGCGGDEVERRVDEARERIERRVDEARRDFRARRERLRERFDEILGQIEQAIPEARRTDPTVRTRGRTEPQTIDAFIADVLQNVDRYWTRTFAEAGLPEPRVRYVIVPPGAAIATSCGARADDRAAFYCPADDSIYIAQRFASDLYAGVVEGLPGQSAGFGRAAGDFAVAYVLAHEYAHNLQQELGLFDNRQTPSARPYELQADCWSGTWANSVYEQGDLPQSDLDEILDAALAVGDFDVGNAQHHGTPAQRRDAVLLGFRTGDPSACARFVPEV
jgi:uncharacterized protein